MTAPKHVKVIVFLEDLINGTAISAKSIEKAMGRSPLRAVLTIPAEIVGMLYWFHYQITPDKHPWPSRTQPPRSALLPLSYWVPCCFANTGHYAGSCPVACWQ